MASTAEMAKDQFLSVTIDGLRKLSDNKASEPTHCNVEVELNTDAPISEIWTKLEELGYQSPSELLNHGSEQHRWSRLDTKSIRLPYFEVTVVGPEEPSDYRRNVINIDDTLISFANQPYQAQSQLQFKLQPESLGAKVTGALKLVVNDSLEIIFHRTLRMPDDNRLHQLPASLGAFPLFNVEEYAGRLPPSIEEQGGIFFPMWQREAMWMGFEIRNPDADLQYAVRIFVGRINAITGLPMNKANEKDENGKVRQDYVVLPEQPWIDGICVAAGVVRQFVAMPLGSGYSVEGQITGTEKFGGLQIEVIPSYRQNLKVWADAPKSGEPEQAYFLNFDEENTPAKLGLKPSDKLRAYPSPCNATVPLKIADLAKKISSDKICLYVPLPEPYVRHHHPLLYVGGGGHRRDHLRSPDEGFISIDDFAPPGAPGVQYEYGSISSPPPLPPDAAAGLSKCNGFSGADFASESKGKKSKSATAQAKDGNLRAMGLAAGGKMVQDIVQDNNAAAIWNLQNAKLMNVHILDPASCEKVTHIVPGPPIDAQTYIDADLPFFVVEENADNRLDEGDFDQVVSVSEMDKKIGVTTESEFDPNKPKMCEECSLRLCDCIIRPCEHQFCNVCIRKLENIEANVDRGQRNWNCPRCDTAVQHVAGFSAPMNLPGEETLKVNVPVTVLKASRNGWPEFQSIYTTRI